MLMFSEGVYTLRLGEIPYLDSSISTWCHQLGSTKREMHEAYYPFGGFLIFNSIVLIS